MSDDAPDPEAATPEKPTPAKRSRLRWFKAHTPLHWLTEFAIVMLLTVGVLLTAIRIAPLNGTRGRKGSLTPQTKNAFCIPIRPRKRSSPRHGPLAVTQKTGARLWRLTRNTR